MKIDKNKIEKLRQKNGKHIGRCPACAEEGKDKKGEHFYLYDDNPMNFGCVVHGEDIAHWSRIKELAAVSEKRPNRSSSKIEAIYDYQNADGKLIFQVVRKSGKKFSQRQPNDSGGWIWNTKGVKKEPYRLPELLKTDLETEVYIVEGEKDADNLAKLGLAATSAPGGAKKWNAQWNQYFAKRKVTLIGDNDKDGKAHIVVLSRELAPICSELKQIDLAKSWAQCPEKGDISDYLEDGGDVATLKREALSSPDSANSTESELFEAYYYPHSNKYYIENKSKRWLQLGSEDLKRRLRDHGMRTKAIEGETISPADRYILDTQDHRDIGYAGSLAGKDTGFYEENGVRYLVTDSPKLIEPKEGDFNTLYSVLENLLWSKDSPQAEVQKEVFLGWLRISIETLQERKRRPGQALAIAGEAGCGKSLLQNLITELLGGRSQKAFSFMNGSSSFNAHLFEAEHLMLEDEVSSRKLANRNQLGAMIKNICVNEEHSCHRKHATPVMLRPFWRLTISLNDDPEAMLVLPPLDDSVKDKLVILKANHAEMPMPTNTLEERDAFRKQLSSELPSFIYWLLNRDIPSEYKDARYGVISFHNTELVEELEQISPEMVLLEIIDQSLFSEPAYSESWEGSASDLKNDLGDGKYARQIQELLPYPYITGKFLTKLSKSTNRVIAMKRNSKKRLWKIKPPRNS